MDTNVAIVSFDVEHRCFSSFCSLSFFFIRNMKHYICIWAETIAKARKDDNVFCPNKTCSWTLDVYFTVKRLVVIFRFIGFAFHLSSLVKLQRHKNHESQKQTTSFITLCLWFNGTKTRTLPRQRNNLLFIREDMTMRMKSVLKNEKTRKWNS